MSFRTGHEPSAHGFKALVAAEALTENADPISLLGWNFQTFPILPPSNPSMGSSTGIRRRQQNIGAMAVRVSQDYLWLSMETVSRTLQGTDAAVRAGRDTGTAWRRAGTRRALKPTNENSALSWQVELAGTQT